MAQWALDALTICVQNGWLPLFYFQDVDQVRRVEFFRDPNGPALVGLYPKPTDSAEDGGMIELAGGDIFPCMVNLADFDKVLTEKFGLASGPRGPRRQFADFDDALDTLFETHPVGMNRKDVIAELAKTFKGVWPRRTTIYGRIGEAVDRARARVRSAKTTDKTSDGQR
jgi:hypothetical protein